MGEGVVSSVSRVDGETRLVVLGILPSCYRPFNCFSWEHKKVMDWVMLGLLPRGLEPHSGHPIRAARRGCFRLTG